MTPEKQILALACLLVVLPIVVTDECPSKEDIAPCICEDPSSIWGLYITCNEIDNEELARVASHLRGWKVTLTIADSRLGSIPHYMFKGIKLNSLTIERSTLVALTDGSEAFVGLEAQLEKLVIFNCVFENKWDWSVLRNLKKLNALEINTSLHLETIGEDLMESSLSSVTYFSLVGNNISFISDHAFVSFKNIASLSLPSNKIKNLKRTMLPNPALKLSLFNIRNNLIEQFPEDMFINIPDLHILEIDHNKILVLNEKAFSPVWEQLFIFHASGNPLNCHCHMSWIPQKMTPDFLYGECASPPELKGKELKKLKSENFMMCHS